MVLFPGFSLLANRTVVSTASEINGGSWVPGDTLIMQNGTWTDQLISFHAGGTAEQPVVLMAETPGEVILTGSSRLAFSGEYITVSGLYFKDGDIRGAHVVYFRTSTSSLANNCRLTNTVIESYNPSSNSTDSKWVSIYGLNNRVDHCSFVNKRNLGTLLVVWLVSGVTPNHIIDHNYFGYRIPNVDSGGEELNGQEIIRIGTSTYSMQNAGVVVSDNFFEHCNGEIEIISNKSCENIFTNNLFYECVGMLTLRHGNRCTVEGNYFFGSGISNTGGVRIIGEDHKVFNNYFEKLQGTGYRAALCMVRGIPDSELNEYFQVKNAQVAFNTMVDCRQSFAINYGSRSEQQLPPIGSTVAHNHVYNTSASGINVMIYQTYASGLDVTWKNNLMNQGIFSGFSPTGSEVITGVDPSMALAGTSIDMYEPGEASPLADYPTNEYPEVTVDIRGRDRDTVKIPGASQLQGSVNREMPARENTGADYFTPPDLPIPVPSVRISADLKVRVVNQEIITTVEEPGTLSVYDITGRCIYMDRVETGPNTINLSRSGIYIIRFSGASGEVLSRKIGFTRY